MNYTLKPDESQEEKFLQVQKYSIDSSHPFFETIKNISFHAARLYNVGLYSLRQYYFLNNAYLNYAENYHAIKENENYKLLLTDIGQLVIRQIDRDMKSFFALLKLKSKGKYAEQVRLPKYKNKEKGITFPIHGRCIHAEGNKIWFSVTKEFQELYGLSDKRVYLNIPKNIQGQKFNQIRIVPRYHEQQFDIEFIYEKEREKHQLDSTKAIGIDCGLDNLATVFDPNGESFIIDGRYIKSVNRHYNKEVAKIRSQADIEKRSMNTKRFIRFSNGRNNRIKDYFNKSVKTIVDYCLSHKIGNIVIGDFAGCKNEINLGKITNQNFVSIPFGKFKQILSNACEKHGINYILQEESYTSKCSAFDLEEIRKHENYCGKRIKRGLFRTKTGKLVNADVNGAANILRKSNLNSSDDKLGAVVTRPFRFRADRSPRIYSGE